MEEKQKKKKWKYPNVLWNVFDQPRVTLDLHESRIARRIFRRDYFWCPDEIVVFVEIENEWRESKFFFFFCWISHFLFLEFKKGEGEIVIKLVGISFLIYSFNFIRENFHARENNLK